MAPPRMPVTTRTIPFLVGVSYKPSFATVTGRGPHPIYTPTEDQRRWWFSRMSLYQMQSLSFMCITTAQLIYWGHVVFNKTCRSVFIVKFNLYIFYWLYNIYITLFIEGILFIWILLFIIYIILHSYYIYMFIYIYVYIYLLYIFAHFTPTLKSNR